ncbi:MAG TPA: alkaline phosphatase, partial [Verrucomicrobiae bacterium]
MNTPLLKIRTLAAGFAIGACVFSQSNAAPTVRRLTPPSALFAFNDPAPPYISRFMPGQRFDLQATVAPDAGQTIAEATFLVDGAR